MSPTQQITRAEFEEAAADLFARVTTPIEEALAMAGLTLENIHAVELVGGGIRMPKVRVSSDAAYYTNCMGTHCISMPCLVPMLGVVEMNTGCSVMLLGVV